MQHFLQIKVHCFHKDYSSINYHFSSCCSIDDVLDTAKLLYHEDYGVLPDKVVLHFNHTFIWKKSEKFSLG